MRLSKIPKRALYPTPSSIHFVIFSSSTTPPPTPGIARFLLEVHCSLRKSRSRMVVHDALVGALDVTVSDDTQEPGVGGRR